MKSLTTNTKFNILAIICIIIFCVTIAPMTLQNDTFYTISIGEHIMQNGINMQDPFSWHNLPYTYPHWAYDVLIYLIYSSFGMLGIYISTCVFCAILGITLYVANCKIAKNHVVSFIITLVSIYLLKDYIAARAQLVTFILFVLEILCIEQFLQKKKIIYAVALIVISILIANLHVAVWPFFFILFLPYIGEYVVALLADAMIERKFAKYRLHSKIKKLSNKDGNEEKVTKFRDRLEGINKVTEKSKIKREQAKKEPYKLIVNKKAWVKWLIVIMIICAFTGLLTPLGDTPYTYLVKTMQGNTTENINEHLPLTPINNEQLLCLMMVYLAVLTFTKTKIELKDLMMIGGLLILTLASKRQQTMFILIGSFIINKMTFETLETYIKQGTEKVLTKEIATKIGAFVTIALTLSISLHFIGQKKGATYIDSNSYPVSACDYILENIDVSNSRFYNDYNYGSYMLFRGIPVFIDSRADLYAPEFNTPTGNPQDGKDIFMDFMDISNIGKYYETLFDEYKITHIITTKNAKIAMLINNRNDDKYKEIYSDDNFVIYEVE